MKLSDNTFISIKIVNDSEIRRLNKKYLKRDHVTDVLSFNMNEKQEDGSYYLGDIVINKEQAERQAREFSNTFEEEIAELAAHGILHLLGVHHAGDDH